MIQNWKVEDYDIIREKKTGKVWEYLDGMLKKDITEKERIDPKSTVNYIGKIAPFAFFGMSLPIGYELVCKRIG